MHTEPFAQAEKLATFDRLHNPQNATYDTQNAICVAN